jgi:hypothetical protein
MYLSEYLSVFSQKRWKRKPLMRSTRAYAFQGQKSRFYCGGGRAAKHTKNYNATITQRLGNNSTEHTQERKRKKSKNRTDAVSDPRIAGKARPRDTLPLPRNKTRLAAAAVIHGLYRYLGTTDLCMPKTQRNPEKHA